MITTKHINELLESLDPHIAVSELVARYDDIDFMQAVVEIASKYKLSPMTLVSMYMKYTGTLSTQLPDNYSLKDFKTPKNSGGSQKKSSSLFR
jgi:hypothetical protein